MAAGVTRNRIARSTRRHPRYAFNPNLTIVECHRRAGGRQNFGVARHQYFLKARNTLPVNGSNRAADSSPPKPTMPWQLAVHTSGSPCGGYFTNIAERRAPLARLEPSVWRSFVEFELPGGLSECRRWQSWFPGSHEIGGQMRYYRPLDPRAAADSFDRNIPVFLLVGFIPPVQALARF